MEHFLTSNWNVFIVLQKQFTLLFQYVWRGLYNQWQHYKIVVENMCLELYTDLCVWMYYVSEVCLSF